MNARTVNQLLVTVALVGTLAACTGAQTPEAAPVVTTPMESSSTPPATVVEATEEATEETTTEATTEAPTEAVTETTTITETEATTETSTGDATGSATTSTVVPLDQAQCETIQVAVDEALGVSTTLEESDFVSEIASQEGQACSIIATGTGEDFGNFLDVAESLRDVFEAEGWSENQTYLADGPTGTSFAYENDNQTAFVSVDWTPSDDAECPDDQPISACELEPNQQIYTIVLNLVQAGE